jgi:hypothetical protein
MVIGFDGINTAFLVAFHLVEFFILVRQLSPANFQIHCDDSKPQGE